jgi:hypothetical protein
LTPIFIEMDLVQAEWVVTAYYSRDAQMLHVINSGIDPHLRTGALISGAPELLIKREADLVGHLTDPVEIRKVREADIPEVYKYFAPRNMAIRQAGKKSNHGLNYDMGPNTFALENGMDQTDGVRCHKAYHRAYPGLQTMYARIANRLNKDRTLENCFGDKRRFLDRWSNDLLRVAYSFIPQSTVVHVINAGLVDAYWDSTPLMKDVEPRAHEHDAGLFHAWIRDWIQASAIAIRLEGYFSRPCCYHGEEFTIAVETKVGPTWGAMETVRDIHSPASMESAYKSACASAG